MNDTPASKVLPPSIPPGFVARPRVDDVLPEALQRRLTTVVAGPGFGKSCLLAHWADQVPAAWYTLDAGDGALGPFARGLGDSLRLRIPGLPGDLTAAAGTGGGPGADEPARAEALVGLLCEALQNQLTDDVALILDDVHEIGEDSAAARLIEGLSRQAPDRLHIVVASRADPPFSIQRMRGQGQVLELSGQQLAFTPDEVGAVLRTVAIDPERLAVPLHELTGGWPAAVHLAAEMLRTLPPEERDAALRRLGRPEGPIFGYLAEEVLRSEPAEVRDLLRTLAPLERFTAGLCAALKLDRAPEILGRLERRGLFVEPLGGGDGWMRLNPVVREFLEDRDPVPEDDRRDLRRRAAEWFEAMGHHEDALRSLQGASEPDALGTFLLAHGERLIDAGLARRVAEAAEEVPDRPAELDVVLGIARQALGEWDDALPLLDRPRGPDALPARLAWRIGLIHYFRGDPGSAREAFERGRIEDGDTADEALLLAWRASLHWMQGDTESCASDVEGALRAASASGDQRALAAAHTSRALLAALEGDRRANDAHYLRALDAAERAGDLSQVVRIRTNRSSHLYEEGWYEQAREELNIAVRVGEVAGFTPLLALAYSNRGWTWLLQGRLDDAAGDFQLARDLYQRLDSRRIAYPLVGLGDVYRERGDLALARASYEEAIRQAEPAHDLQGLIPALAGLGRVLAAEDPVAAMAVCERAMGYPGSLNHVTAVLGGGWVALVAGERERAQELGRAAALLARERRDRAGLAEALELEALASEAPDHGPLEEAKRLWEELGNEVGSARVATALDRLAGTGSPGEPSPSERRLAALGVRPQSGAAGLLAALPIVSPDPTTVRTLGGFVVVRDGRPLPVAEWQSKKSRDLLKVLLARRGRPAHREVLIEALWPDDDPDAVANRLSVALSGIRSALDPDKRHPPDHFVAGDRESVGLDLEHLHVDVERFLALADRGRALVREHLDDEAIPVLQAAEEMYAGDFLEEDAYEEWVVPLREEARAAYIAVTRALADRAGRRGDHDTAIRCWLRILERDPYDEPAGLGLVRSAIGAGRHGEARRHYRTYVDRMRDLDVEPAPFPTADEPGAISGN